MVFQLQLTRRIVSAPLTRDYIGPAEQAGASRSRARQAA
jgi:hypothetical protein